MTLFDFFVKKSRLKLAKNKTKAKQHPEAETETIYQTKIIGNILKRVQKILCLFMINYNRNKVENENRSYRYERNRPCHRHEHKYTKCNMCVSMVMIICTKQYLSNIVSSDHEKVKQHRG